MPSGEKRAADGGACSIKYKQVDIHMSLAEGKRLRWKSYVSVSTLNGESLWKLPETKCEGMIPVPGYGMNGFLRI